MILESCGVFQVDSKHVRLVSDIYTPSGEINLQPEATDANSTIEQDDDIDYLHEEEEDDEIYW
ncbi:hypothetical protein D3C78_1995450 [compost metagenome]